MATKAEVLHVAHELFVERGYRATTTAAVAEAAGVSSPTVYAAFSTKADLLRRVIEVALAGDDEAVAVADRPTVAWVNQADDGPELLRRYAVMCGEMSVRSGPVFNVLAAAADVDPALAELVDTFETQRLFAARAVAGAVAERGDLRTDLTIDEARDVIWVGTSSELFTLASKREWPLERYVEFLRQVFLQITN
ncbi:TetR family transcriptional regulator [soil metagenome]